MSVCLPPNTGLLAIVWTLKIFVYPIYTGGIESTITNNELWPCDFLNASM